MYHVKNGVSTNITSYMNGVTYDGGNLIHSGASNLDNVIPDGICNFQLVISSDYVYNTDEVDVCDVYGFLTGWPITTGTSTVNGNNVTSLTAGSTASSNSFDITKGELIELVYLQSSISALSVQLFDSSDSLLGVMTPAVTGDVLRNYITAPKTLEGVYIKITALVGTFTGNTFVIRKPYSNNNIKYSVSSPVDYGGLKYDSATWGQYIWKSATVRRSPRAELTQIGSEVNGKIVIEKSTSALRYIIKCKVTESEFEAFVHSMSGDVTVIDQTGRTFTAANVELEDPNWSQGNGVVGISFVDESNINVFTLNNSAL